MAIDSVLKTGGGLVNWAGLEICWKLTRRERKYLILLPVDCRCLSLDKMFLKIAAFRRGKISIEEGSKESLCVRARRPRADRI